MKTVRSCSGPTVAQQLRSLKKKKIVVIETKKVTDGKMHIEVCGAVKGTQFLFLIPRGKLDDALMLGFRVAP